MKHLATLVTLFLSYTMLAQGPVEFPWNPDSDGDDFIGVNDLMALLGEFDSVFSEEGLYLSEDSLSAMYNVGNKTFLECQISCKNLPGRWSMPDIEDVTVAGEEMWLKHDEFPNANNNVFFLTTGGYTVNRSMISTEGCWCVTKERPRVEYSYCSGGAPSSEGFNQCINEKLAEGWYPLSGFPVARDRQGYLGGSDSWNTHYGAQSHASFWRWAD